MKSIICLLIGHKKESHLDYIYGTLPREHIVCLRCNKKLSFERPSMERELELQKGWIGDGDTRGCKEL